MKGEIEIERAAANAAAAGFRSQLLDPADGAGNGDRLPGIDCTDLERAADLGEQLFGISRTQPKCRHAAVAARLLLVAAPRDDDAHSFGERQRPGGPSGSNLPDAVADMSGGIHPEAA